MTENATTQDTAPEGAATELTPEQEDVLGDAVAFEGVSKYPARIKCALLGWMAWKDATAKALEGFSES